MKLNQYKTDNSYNLLNKNDFLKYSDKIQNLTYFYPYVHRMNHQMRWLKVSLGKGYEKGIAS